MRTSDRRGFSLVELLIALIMLGLFASAFYKVLTAVQRTSGRQTHQANLQGNLRSGIQLVQSELQELRTDAALDSTDILAMSATAIRYRVMRGVGEACDISATIATVRKANWYAPRAPNATWDGLAVYWDQDTTRVDDDLWRLKPINGGIGSGTCPVVGDEAWTVPVDLSGEWATMHPPIPVRTYEEMELGLVTSGGQDWLGIRAINKGENTLIPVIGPLATGGVAFEYFNLQNPTTPLSGSSLATRSDVRTIILTLTGVTAQTVHTGVGVNVGNPTDLITIRIQLRNAL